MTLTAKPGDKPKYLTRESLARRFQIDVRNGLLDHFHPAARTEMGRKTVKLFLNDPSLTLDRLKAYADLQKNFHGLQRVAQYRKLAKKYGEDWDKAIKGQK
jgi:hypothetical protein